MSDIEEFEATLSAWLEAWAVVQKYYGRPTICRAAFDSTGRAGEDRELDRPQRQRRGGFRVGLQWP